MRRLVAMAIAVTMFPLLPTGVPAAARPASAAAAPAPACEGCPPPVECPDCWKPPATAVWQIQLQGVEAFCATTGGVNTDVSAVPYTGGPAVSPTIYAFDPFVDNGVCTDAPTGTLDSAAVDALHAEGLEAIAYIDAGTWEQWRPDAQSYVNFDERCGGCLLGDALSRYADERWFNIGNDRGQRDFLLRKMEARIEKASRAGFDGVYFDNQDEWQYASPFDIGPDDQLMYLTGLLNIAHGQGLAAGPNNDILQTELFEPYADFMVNEQCFQYDECFHMRPMTDARKPVFEIEYRPKQIEQFCKRAERRAFNTIRKSNDLYDLPWRPCR